MKLSICLLLFTVMQAWAVDSYSQIKELSIDLEGTTLEQVLKAIEEQSEFYFLYSPKIVDVTTVVDLNVENLKINETLSQLFAGTGIEYVVKDRQIVLSSEELIRSFDNESVQQLIITGSITDENGESLPGANIVVQGTTIGTITDLEGNYSIEVANPDVVLEFSYVGYQSQQIRVGENRLINVAMIPELIGMEEIVVIGYGTQRRINLTGSITRVETEEIEDISTPLLTQSLAGRSPGLFIRNTQGMPGEDDIELSIRGYGDPLIIVDGTEVSEAYFQQLESEDIESINILKDASAAAVYGARAGNGVIIVNTKRGTIGAPSFNFNTRTGFQYFTAAPEFLSSAEYAEMENVARMVAGKAPMYSQSDIDLFRSGTDPDYPSTDWWDEVFKTTSPSYEGNLSARGGTERVAYFVSGGYYQQRGFLESDDIKNERYSLRNNLDVSLTDNLKLGIDLSLTNQDFIAPPVGDLTGNMMRISRSNPTMRVYRDGGRAGHPDPSKVVIDPAMFSGPYVTTFIDNAGYTDWNRLYGFAKIRFSYDLPLGFEVESSFDLNRTIYESSAYSRELPCWSYDEDTDTYSRNYSVWTSSRAQVDERRNIDKAFNMQHFLRYEGTFGDHDLNGMVAFERMKSSGNTVRARRREYIFDLPYLDYGDSDQQNTWGSADQAGRRSYIGRLNYTFRDKYLLELSGRYDGSPNFPPDTRWGFFPSASIGWRIDQENFMDNLAWVNSLKLRFSHGLTGYDRAGDFQYVTTFSLESDYIYEGEASNMGIRTDGLANSTITWEKMRTTNLGLDFVLLNNALEGQLEFFYRLRSDVLGERIASVPDIVGAVMPRENFEEYDNRGFELALGHRNNIGDLQFHVEGNIAYQREKIVYVDQEDFATMEGYRTGDRLDYWTDHVWVYPTDGLFKTQEEVDNWGADIDGRGNATIAPGDVKFIDYNGDGRITPEDRIIAGGGGTEGTPKVLFGMNLSVNWKGFDFNALFQGATMYNLNWDHCKNLMHPFWADNQPIKFMYDNNYTPENPWKAPISADEALWPRFGDDSWNRSHPNYKYMTEFWLSNGTYLRLKNVVLGYTLPASVTNRLRIDRLRVYVSGYNLKVWSAFSDIIDPEQYSAYYVSHPPLGNIQFGLDLGF